MGRYEEAIAAAEHAIELGRDMGRPVSVVMNYSTLALREIFALDDALTRSEGVAELLGPSDFNMPWMKARADVFVARVMKGDLSTAESSWDALWDDAVGSKAWERWIVSGRLAAARAELELARGRIDDAQTWSMRAIDMAVTSSRKKYEVIARTTLGRALVGAGLGQRGGRRDPSGGGGSSGARFAFHSLAGPGGIRGGIVCVRRPPVSSSQRGDRDNPFDRRRSFAATCGDVSCRSTSRRGARSSSLSASSRFPRDAGGNG